MEPDLPPPADDPLEPPLCPEQQKVKELALAGRNIFLTGCGGCGKSHLIKCLVAHWEREGKEVSGGCWREVLGRE